MWTARTLCILDACIWCACIWYARISPCPERLQISGKGLPSARNPRTTVCPNRPPRVLYGSLLEHSFHPAKCLATCRRTRSGWSARGAPARSDDAGATIGDDAGERGFCVLVVFAAFGIAFDVAFDDGARGQCLGAQALLACDEVNT